MSYTEYFDLYYAAQKKDCKYKAFLIDVKNSRTVLQDPYEEEYIHYHKFVDYITKRLCAMDKINGKDVFLQDENNQKVLILEHLCPHDNLKSNPMILGNCACFFVNNHTITDEQFIGIVCEAIKKFDVNFSFHFLSGQYETEDYAKGGHELYKGYMLPILEFLSKKWLKSVDIGLK